MNQDSRQVNEHQELDIELIERLSRTLLHTLRGDLSVLQSELSYLSGLYAEKEVACALSRCRSIAAKLTTLEAFRAPTERNEGTSLDEILRGLDFEAASIQGAKDFRRSDLQTALSFLPRSLRRSPQSCTFERVSGDVHVTMRLAVENDPFGRPFRGTSLSRFTQGRFSDVTVLEALVADFILRAHGWRVLLECTGHDISCTFQGPASRVSYQGGEAA